MITIKTQFKHCLLIALLGLTALLPQITLAQQPKQNATKTPIGTSTIWGTVDGLTVEGLVQGPSSAKADLQVACVFEYTEGDIFISPPALPAELNGMVHLDEALRGIITEIRRSGKFKGHAFETLLITPPKGMLAAQKLLLVGLGNRKIFSPDMMITVGSVAMNEAIRLGIQHYAFASDLKDAGIDSPTALVAENVVLGSIEAYRTQQWLKEHEMTNDNPVSKITLLAGPAFFTIAGEGIKTAVAKPNN